MRTIHDLSIEELLEDIIKSANPGILPSGTMYQAIREAAIVALEKVRFEHANRQVDEFDQQAEDQAIFFHQRDQEMRR